MDGALNLNFEAAVFDKAASADADWWKRRRGALPLRLLILLSSLSFCFLSSTFFCEAQDGKYGRLGFLLDRYIYICSGARWLVWTVTWRQRSCFFDCSLSIFMYFPYGLVWGTISQPSSRRKYIQGLREQENLLYLCQSRLECEGFMLYFA